MAPPDRLIIPDRLKPGDIIGIVSPAGPVDHEALKPGLAVVEKMGFQARVTEEVFSKTGYLAGSDKDRAKSLNQSFLDPKISAIFCARGGFGSLRILPFLDYDTIGRHPKILIGFSDITALLSTIYHRCSLVTFHGPTVSSSSPADDMTQSALFDALSSESPVVLSAQSGTVVNSGTVTAPVIAGNLTTFCHLIGTPYSPDFSGHIVIFEDIGEAPYRVDRMLTQMKFAGCFAGISGIVIGQFKNCGSNDEIAAIFAYVFRDLDIPVISGFGIGHSRPNVAIPIGLVATLDTRRSSLIYHRAATCI